MVVVQPRPLPVRPLNWVRRTGCFSQATANDPAKVGAAYIAAQCEHADAGHDGRAHPGACRRAEPDGLQDP
jgi:hypothetical protein